MIKIFYTFLQNCSWNIEFYLWNRQVCVHILVRNSNKKLLKCLYWLKFQLKVFLLWHFTSTCTICHLFYKVYVFWLTAAVFSVSGFHPHSSIRWRHFELLQKTVLTWCIPPSFAIRNESPSEASTTLYCGLKASNHGSEWVSWFHQFVRCYQCMGTSQGIPVKFLSSTTVLSTLSLKKHAMLWYH